MRPWQVVLVVSIVCLVGLTQPERAVASCWSCDSQAGCVETCLGAGGYAECSYILSCNNECVVVHCGTGGSSCTGTRECAACSQALEECGIENSGVRLIVPHGELPPAGSWLEKKGRELRLCRSTIEQSLGPRPVAVGPLRPGRS